MKYTLKLTEAGPLLLTAMLASGCTWGLGQGDVPEMHKSLSRAVTIQTAVVLGDLERARKAASWLMDREDKMLVQAGSNGYEKEMLGYAALIATAEDLKTVATQAGRLAATCGSCHQALNEGPRFVVGTDAPGGETQEAQMIRHLWAADRMWEGLVGPSDDAWTAGALALAETAPSLAEAIPAYTRLKESRTILRHVNEVANQAMTVGGLSERAEVYGRMLDTCMRCHAEVGLMEKG